MGIEEYCPLCGEYQDLWLMYNPRNQQRFLMCMECYTLIDTTDSILDFEDAFKYIESFGIKMEDAKIVERNIREPYDFSLKPQDSDKELPNYTFP